MVSYLTIIKHTNDVKDIYGCFGMVSYLTIIKLFLILLF